MRSGDLVEAIVELAQIPAPTFAEGKRISWLERALADAPGRRHRDAVGNLVWSWEDDPPVVLVMAHVDTVFPADTPLRIRREDGALVGPGSGDNAAAVIVTLAVVLELLAGGKVAPGAVAFTVGEEGLGNLRGAKAACEALRPACAIAVEGHGLEQLLTDCVGSVRVRLRVVGPGGHSWVDRGTPSAIHALLELGASLARRSTREVPVNVGLIGGGRSVNAIADEAELVVEARAVGQAALDEFHGVLRGLSVAPGLELAAEVLGERPAGRLDPADPLLRVVREVREELGLPAASSAGSTDANAAIALGVPALALGVATGSGMHSLDERIDTASLALGREQLLRVLRRLLSA